METKDSPRTDELLWSGLPSNWFYAGRWFLLVLLIAASVASFWLDLKDWKPWDMVVHFLPLAIALVLILWISVARATRRYQVTNNRVIVEFGIVSKSSNEIRVQDIRSINVKRQGFSGLLGIGNVEFSSAATDDADVIFWRIAGADQVRDLVRKLQA